MNACALAILPRVGGRVIVLDLVGDLDLLAATEVMGILTELAESGSRVVVCDLSRLAVPQQKGFLVVFAAAQRRCGSWPRSSLHLAAPSLPMARQLAKMGMPRFLPVHATIEAALAAATAEANRTQLDLILPADPTSPRAARQAVSRLWPEQDTEQDAHHDARLVTSELATNATRHASGPFAVSLALSSRSLLVAVTDDSRQEPTLRPAGTWTSCGRGIPLVAAASHDWGVRLIHKGGKTVWATLDRVDARGPIPEVG